MRKRIGTKTYDTEKATLIDTMPDGIQVYRKTGRSTEFFLYNPNGKVGREMFFDLPSEQAIKYIPENTADKKIVYSNTIRFTPYDIERIRKYALLNNMSMSKFLVMLVDNYERTHKIRKK